MQGLRLRSSRQKGAVAGLEDESPANGLLLSVRVESRQALPVPVAKPMASVKHSVHNRYCKQFQAIPLHRVPETAGEQPQRREAGVGLG